MPISLPPISRRRFLSRSLTASAALALTSRLFAATKARDEHSWVLMADTHIAADRATVSRKVNMAEHLASVATELVELPEIPAGVFVVGDCAYTSGEKAEYALFSELIRPIRETQLPVHLTLGNHDHRERFREMLKEDSSAEHPVTDKQVMLLRSPRVNWFVLDSLEKTLATPGWLGAEQLEWLAKGLDANKDKPALILVHHNMGMLANVVGIRDTEEFFKVIRPRSQVKACIFGHTHNWSVMPDESGIHLINLPPVAYVFQEGKPSGWMKASLLETGMRLEMRCIDRAHSLHGKITELNWRS